LVSPARAFVSLKYHAKYSGAFPRALVVNTTVSPLVATRSTGPFRRVGGETEVMVAVRLVALP